MIVSSSKIILITVVVSFITTNPLYNLINEHILIIIIWGVTLIAFNLVFAETKQGKKVNTILLDIVLIYGLFIHTRFLVLIIAICMAIVIYRFLYKKWLVAPFFVVILGGGYFFARYIIQLVQIAVWGSTNLVNASVEFTRINNFDIFQLLTGFSKVILGNIGTFIIFSVSSGGFILGALIYYFVQYGIKNKGATQQEKAIIFVISIFFLSTAGILIALGYNNMQLFSVMEKEGKVYSVKLLTYLRYYLLFTIPLYFVGLVLYFNHIDLYKKTYIGSLFYIVGILLLWINFIVPVISETYYGMSTFYPFSYLLHLKVKLSIDDFRAIVVMISSMTFLFVIIAKRNRMTVLFLIASIFIYQYLYFAIEIAIPQEKRHYSSVEKSINYVTGHFNKEQLIYVYDKTKIKPFIYQAYLYQYKIMPGLPNNFDNDVIILSNENIDMIIPENISSLKIDDDEWIYDSYLFLE